MSRIALATYDPGDVPTRDPDLAGLVGELRARGADAESVRWDDAAIDWAGYDLVVIRSTWDYSWRAAEFGAWVDRVDALTRLANPAGVVRWNADKRYLGELAAAGVPTVPTDYFAPGDPVSLPAEGEFVIKPTSGAGARFAARYLPGEHGTALRQISRMHAEGFTAMVQPYMPAIDVTGERALQFFGGRLLHASRKGAVLTPGTPYDAAKVAHPRLEPWTPTPSELALAQKTLAALPHPSDLLYARIDIVDGPTHTPHLMELELIEPQLFLDLHPTSLPEVAEEIIKAAR
ncbi:hypothetical protein KUM39_24995 [Streptomyces sp. J2-1]|uniref:ATP-grasp domain-containing protein n=1 Tax=Streptomyces corallincola TaxID=2851888 RepID=UPI001C381457|nr:hypothetical protein [Streptomyces corallincola]MBV2357582.1 hypothetical protein [Streptomyces corallincola]